MATRDDLLLELGLLPRWRRRTRAGLAVTGLAAAASDALAEPALETPVTPVKAALEAPVAPMKAAPEAPVPPVKSAIETTMALAGTVVAAAPAGERVEASARPGGTTDVEARCLRIAALEWPAFAADVDACGACGLGNTRKRSVPGVGDTRADWLFVGEAPGSEEDAKGEPFVGQAGRLLDNMLGALGLARGDRVYIANVLKCRPPGNRTPEPLEVAACLPYLDRQIALIRPRLIVALGMSAATALLQVDATIASLRGRVHRYRDVPLIVTYHPAYLLRNLVDKAKAWEDLLFARRTMASQSEKSSPG